MSAASAAAALARRDECARLQVAAPVGTERLKSPVLLGPGGKPAVKLFIFAPAQCYDFVSQASQQGPPELL